MHAAFTTITLVVVFALQATMMMPCTAQMFVLCEFEQSGPDSTVVRRQYHSQLMSLSVNCVFCVAVEACTAACWCLAFMLSSYVLGSGTAECSMLMDMLYRLACCSGWCSCSTECWVFAAAQLRSLQQLLLLSLYLSVAIACFLVSCVLPFHPQIPCSNSSAALCVWFWRLLAALQQSKVATLQLYSCKG